MLSSSSPTPSLCSNIGLFSTSRHCISVSRQVNISLKTFAAKGKPPHFFAMSTPMQRIPNEQKRNELGDIQTLTEERINQILQKFLYDLQEDALEVNGWQKIVPAYSISKATLNAYTRVLAKKCPHMYVNCVYPGYVNTDLNWHTGTMTVKEGAEGPVMLALLPDGGPTGHYFDRTQLAEF